MKKSVKNTSIFILSLLLTIFGSNTDNILAKDKSAKTDSSAKKVMDSKPNVDKKKNKNFKKRLAKLEKNVEWLKFGDLWKIVTYNKKKNLNILLKQAQDLLQLLQDKDLLTSDESALLLALFSERVTQGRGSPVPPGATCYLAGPDLRGAATKEDLEKRYKLLENLANNNKISPETYETVKADILKDIAKLNLRKFDPSKVEDNEELVQLLYSLSKGVNKSNE